MNEPHVPQPTIHRRPSPVAARHWRTLIGCGLLAMLPSQAPAQALGQAVKQAAGADCRVELGQRVGELLQAMSDARRRRSSMTLGLKLMPYDGRLKVLRAQIDAQALEPSQCQAMATLIEADRARLMELIPEQLTAAPAVAAPPPSPTPAAAPTMPAAAPAAACGADLAQARLELSQRVVTRLQEARLDPQALEPYLDLSRRLLALEPPMAAQGADCAAYGTALGRANAEWQRLKARPPGVTGAPGAAETRIDPALEGSMPLAALRGAELCVTNLRMAARELHIAASNQVASARDPAAKARAREVEGEIVQQQLAAFGAGPLSALACESAYQALGPVRSAVAALRTPPPAPVPSPAPALVPYPAPQAPATYAGTIAPPAPTGGGATFAAPAPAYAAAPAAPPAAGGGNPGFVACAERNRGLFAELERESQAGKAANRLPPSYWSGVDSDVAMYRNTTVGPGYVLQCGEITRHLTFVLGNVRRQVASASAASPPSPQAAPPQAAPAQAAPAQAAPPRQGLMGGLANRVAPAAPPAPAPPPPPAPAPAKVAAPVAAPPPAPVKATAPAPAPAKAPAPTTAAQRQPGAAAQK